MGPQGRKGKQRPLLDHSSAHTYNVFNGKKRRHDHEEDGGVEKSACKNFKMKRCSWSRHTRALADFHLTNQNL